MLELNVVLDFACCNCEHPISVTVQCAGKGLAAGSPTVAAVKVPCPACGDVNQLYFEPSGRVRAVAPCRGRQHRPEPSLN